LSASAAAFAVIAAAAASLRGFALPHLMLSLSFFSCGAYVSYIYQLGEERRSEEGKKVMINIDGSRTK
jgi:hypothetical protein